MAMQKYTSEQNYKTEKLKKKKDYTLQILKSIVTKQFLNKSYVEILHIILISMYFKPVPRFNH